MSTRKPILAASLVFVATLSMACSAPGGDAGGDSAGAGSAADTVAKDLGIDLAGCAEDPTAKLSGVVKLGGTYAMSGGPATAFAPVGQGQQVAVKNFSATSGLSQTFELVQADDQFAPDKALTATQKLIDQDKVAAMTGTIGTPAVLAIRPLLEKSCVPLVAGQAGAASAQQPGKFPWTITFTLPSALDARIWAASVAEQFPEGAKVAMFYANDSSGKEFLAAAQKYIGETKSEIVSTQTIEDTDSAAPASQVTTLRSSGATVLLAAPTGSQCASLMKEVAGQGWKPTFFMSSTCATTLFDVAGPAADGVYVNQYSKDPTRAPYNTDPAVLDAVEALKKYSPETAINNSSITGMMCAEPLFEAIKRTQSSELGLSRLGLLQAATHMQFQPALGIPGVQYALDYPTDMVAMESAQLTRYTAGTKTFDQVKLYDFEGQMTGSASS
jgi:ABC-type branched-subunit amino acid transport system substrate-binding protein